ncbi:MAG: hypothetical protein GVY04_15995 [Cyanobacteria bacterium]|nr:hypothetical protein [Cyanobacteria bacterium GSL.Bin1]
MSCDSASNISAIAATPTPAFITKSAIAPLFSISYLKLVDKAQYTV